MLTEQGQIRICQLERRHRIYTQLYEKCEPCRDKFADFMLMMDKLHLQQSIDMYSKGIWHCISTVPDTLEETDRLLNKLEKINGCHDLILVAESHFRETTANNIT